jgi:CBS domain-containing protein
MFDEPVRNVMRPREVLKAAPETPISEAAKLMAAKKTRAIIVVERGRLVGIFTERDMVFRVVARDLDPRATRLADVMTCAPYTIDSDELFGCALLVVREKGIRHLPVVQHGKPIGIVSSRAAMDPELEEFASEEYRRKSFNKMRRSPTAWRRSRRQE